MIETNEYTYEIPSYSEFRTHLTFADVRRILQREQRLKRENFEYMFVTRKTVLGRWHQIKKTMYQSYLQEVGKCL